jgi:uncharacterized protein involved in exopolysaccharide biosynthesis
MYRAELVVAPSRALNEGAALDRLSSSLGSLGSLIGLQSGGQAAEVAAALAVLRSRSFTEEFIRAHGLRPLLYPEDSSTWREWKEPSLQDAYVLFDRKLRTVSQDRRTGLVTITVEWRDSSLAASWANQMVADLNATLRKRALTQSKAASVLLKEKLASESSLEARQALSYLLQSELRREVLAQSRPEFAFETIEHAQPSEANRYVSPKRLVWTLAGLIAGGAGAILWFVIASSVAAYGAGRGRERPLRSD